MNSERVDDTAANARGETGSSDSALDRWSRLARESGTIDPALFGEYDVKRGLRDLTGHGVLAGLTRIGDVVGYTEQEDGTTVPTSGRLLYRGIEIRELIDGFAAEDRHGFEETCYLLLFGELPDRAELELFRERLASGRAVPRHFVNDVILPMPSRDIMNAMARGVLALYVLDEDPDDTSVPAVLRQSMRLISTFPLLAVYAYHASAHRFKAGSLFIHRPDSSLSTAENILHMLRPDNRFTPLEAAVLDMALVLHAEHGGGTNSSFTARVVSSSATDTYSVIAAALGSLKGPRHGGANIKVVKMFQELKSEIRDWSDDEEITSYLLRILNKEAFDRSGLVYGMGHPVYSVSDPRTLILREYAERLAAEKGLEDEFNLHAKIEVLAPAVISGRRKIYKGVSANVDFYSGFVYQMLGIPEALYTPLFAVSRIVGWSAHHLEEITGGGRVIRPAYKSLSTPREYVPLDRR
ncbi:MAG: citrate/2-methylcitrate synthase [Coriobacteriia bacterium]|nr:citrate/2-methylcitrate synthase [Coriobacteriia bacterium]